MPELPEVESVRASLHKAILPDGTKILGVQVHRRDLRFPVPRGFEKKLLGQKIIGVRRRAKYLLFDLVPNSNSQSSHKAIEKNSTVFLSHLGMSGSWRLCSDKKVPRRRHDHLDIELDNGTHLIFHDPRRFGYVGLFPADQELQNSFLQHLGPEPLSPDFNGDLMFKKSRNKIVNIKNFIMDQKNVVGVGNIYVCEALFAAGIRPARRASKVTLREWQKLTEKIKEILQAAIASGGTTLRDYVQADGKQGEFKQKLFVYGREHKPCLQCRKPVANLKISGRSSFWCKTCQT